MLLPWKGWSPEYKPSWIWLGGRRAGATFPGMTPPPTDALRDLAEVLGEDNVRSLVRTFLSEFPVSVQELTRGDRKNRHRIAHSLKSNARLMGALRLSERMASLEARLEGGGEDVTPGDLASIQVEFDEIAGPLRGFVQD